MMEDLKSIKKELEELNISEDEVAQIFSSTTYYENVNVASLINAYAYFYNMVKSEFEEMVNDVFTSKSTKSKRVMSVFKSLEIANVRLAKEDNYDVYLFDITSEFPYPYRASLKISKIQEQNNELRDNDDSILLTERTKDSEYDISYLVNCNSTALGLAIAKIFAKHFSESKLFRYLSKKYYLEKNVTYSLYAEDVTKYKVEIKEGKYYRIKDDKNRNILLMGIDEPICVDDRSIFGRDPLWMLKNLYIKASFLIESHCGTKISRYFDRDEDFIRNQIISGGYDKTSTFEIEYPSVENKIEFKKPLKYFMKNNDGELVRVNCTKAHHNEDGTITFHFLDETCIIVPASEVYTTNTSYEDNASSAEKFVRKLGGKN